MKTLPCMEVVLGGSLCQVLPTTVILRRRREMIVRSHPIPFLLHLHSPPMVTVGIAWTLCCTVHLSIPISFPPTLPPSSLVSLPPKAGILFSLMRPTTMEIPLFLPSLVLYASSNLLPSSHPVHFALIVNFPVVVITPTSFSISSPMIVMAISVIISF